MHEEIEQLSKKFNSDTLEKIEFESIKQLDTILQTLQGNKIEKLRIFLKDYINYLLNFYEGDNMKALHQKKVELYNPVISHLSIYHGFWRDGWQWLFIVPGLVIDLILFWVDILSYFYFLPVITITFYLIGYIFIWIKKRQGKYLIG